MKKRKIKVGVFGANRGMSMINVMLKHPDAELVAICDRYEPRLACCREISDKAGSRVAYYTDFDKFMNHDFEAVVLANYATEHAPFAVRLLDSGRHVCSEVVACQTLGEAVALVEAVERSKKIYAFAENYCYFRETAEMKRLYRKGDIGEFLYGEGEYVHDCGSIWTSITYGDKNHWRNWIPATFYCTHSMGPIVTVTQTRPVRISAYEMPNINTRKFGRRGGDGSVIVCQMSNGAVVKIIPWGNFKQDSIWYSIRGENGVMETGRWTAHENKLHVYTEKGKGKPSARSYVPSFPLENKISKITSGHDGSDFYTMHYFLEAILGRPGKEEVIDVYQALDMTLVGTLGWRSIVNGNVPLEVPDFRNKAIRNKYRNDNWCADPKYAGPRQSKISCSSETIAIPDSVYKKQQNEFMKKQGS